MSAHGYRRRTPTRLIASALIAVTTLAGAACSEPGQPQPGSTAAAFPVTIETANGPVDIERRPDRIVALSVTMLDALAALDVPVVAITDSPGGATDFTTLAQTYPWVDDIASGTVDPGLVTKDFRADAETIATYKPDLVLGGPFALAQPQFDQLLKIAAPLAFDWDASARLDQLLTDLGAATGTSARVPDVLDDVLKQQKQLQAKLAGLQGKTHSLVFVKNNGDFSVSSAPWLTSVGLKPADLVTDGKYHSISAENLDQLDADVLLIAAQPPAVAQLIADPRYQQLPSVKQGAVIFNQHAFSAVSRDGPASRTWLTREIGPLLQATPLNRGQ